MNEGSQANMRYHFGRDIEGLLAFGRLSYTLRTDCDLPCWKTKSEEERKGILSYVRRRLLLKHLRRWDEYGNITTSSGRIDGVYSIAYL